jgi:hypothetical protein
MQGLYEVSGGIVSAYQDARPIIGFFPITKGHHF